MAESRRHGSIDPAVFDHVRVAIIVTDLTGRILDCNRQAEVLYGRSRAELVGADAISFAVGPLDPATTRAIASRLAAGDTWEGDFRVRRAGGSIVDVHAIDSPLLRDDGSLEGVVSIAMDVTERRRAERRLAAQHAATRVLAEAGTLEEASARILPVVCDALGWQVGALWRPDQASTALACVDVWRAPEVPEAFEGLSREYRFPPGVGLPGRVWASAAPAWIHDVVRDDNFPRAEAARQSGLHGAFGVPVASGGEFLGVLEFFGTSVEEPDRELLDMMESVGSQVGQFMRRRQAEAEVEASAARMGAIVRTALDCLVSIDHLGHITEFNPAAEQTFDYAREEVLGRPMAELIVPPSLREQHHRGFARYLATNEGTILGRRVEITAMRRDGSEFPVELTVTRVDQDGPPVFTGFVRDITRRRAADRALEESRARLAHLAGTLQQSLLPPTLPDVPGVELAAIYRPGGEGERVGGDFYDVFERTPGDWAVVAGDVCGKGPEAAALTALARYTIRAAAIQTEDPAAILGLLNDAILRQHPERFCTAVYLRLRHADVGMGATVACAGHPLPLRRMAAGAIDWLGRPGRLLGVTADHEAPPSSTTLGPGDVVVLYTDGLTDARRGGERFGEERLRTLLDTAGPTDTASVIAHRLEEAVLDFREEQLRDDLAVVVLRVEPSAG